MEPEFPLLNLCVMLPGKTEIDTKAQEARADAGRHFAHAGGRLRIGTDRGATGTEDMRLFPADLLARIAEILLVIQVNAGEDRAVGIDDVDRIQAPAQTHFEHSAIETRGGEQREHRQGGEFEISEQNGRIAQTRRLDLRKGAGQRGIADLGAGDARAFVESQQVWRGVQAGAVAASAQDRVKHGAGRTLAVGAAHDDGHASKRKTHASPHQGHPLKAELDAARMQLLDIGEPRGQRGIGIRCRRRGL